MIGRAHQKTLKQLAKRKSNRKAKGKTIDVQESRLRAINRWAQVSGGLLVDDLVIMRLELHDKIRHGLSPDLATDTVQMNFIDMVLRQVIEGRYDAPKTR